MKFKIICLILSLLCLEIYGESYKDAKVVDFTIDNEKQLDALKRLELDSGVCIMKEGRIKGFLELGVGVKCSISNLIFGL